MDLAEVPDQPSGDLTRAFAVGVLVGPLLTLFYFLAEFSLKSIANGSAAAQPFRFLLEFAGFGIGSIVVLAFAMPFAGLAAMLCITVLVALEKHCRMTRNALVWAICGAAFATPLTLLFPLGQYLPITLWLAGCGAFGGFCARLAYKGWPLKSAPETLPAPRGRAVS